MAISHERQLWEPVRLTTMERRIARWLPSLADVLFIGVLLSVVLGFQGRTLGMDGDIGWGLRIGLQTLAHGLPRTELMLSGTLGQPTVYWEWLAQVAYAAAWRLGGLNGVVALAGALAAVTALGLLASVRRHGVPLLLALALTLAGVGLTSITWTARAQLFSLPLTLWWTEQLWAYWRDGKPRHLWWLPPVMVLWANLHGGFIGGLILLGTALAVSLLVPRHGPASARHLAVALAGSLGATLVTPWGLALPAHILAYARNPLIARYTQEYQSPDFHTLSGLMFLGMIGLLLAGWMRTAWRTPTARASRQIDPLAVAHVTVWTVLALLSIRFVPLWAVIVTPLIGSAVMGLGQVAGPSQGDARTGRRVAWLQTLAGAFTRLSSTAEAVDALVRKGLWATLCATAVIILIASHGVVPGTSMQLADARFDSHVFPVQAAARLRAEGVPAGRGFTTYEWGGYLDFALPGYHVFIDSRSDAYSEAHLREYAAIVGVAPDWNTLLQREDIRWALVPTDAPLTQVLRLAADWHCAPADAQGVATLCIRHSVP